MNLAVIDASVVAAIVFGEPEGWEWAQQINSYALLAPDLLDYEIASVCQSKLKRQPEHETRWWRVFDDLADLQIQRYALGSFGVQDKVLVQLAMHYGLTVYDSAYLGLALAQDCPLFTQDKALAKAWRQATAH